MPRRGKPPTTETQPSTSATAPNDIASPPAGDRICPRQRPSSHEYGTAAEDIWLSPVVLRFSTWKLSR
ncbi:hypothetical protein HMPREF9577_00315 [Cutibacterium acnes HL110PA3]|nr:hypothetical protein HMPREF9577_00315 [Cutibacterium acnes HL110PA3]